MKHIWDVLQIEPTRDKRAIRRAYAARAKIVHPEEKPEEFMELHEAYQLALKYAGSPPDKVDSSSTESLEDDKKETVSKGEAFPEFAPEDSEDYGLSSFFTDRMERQEQDLENFKTMWSNIQSTQLRKEAEEAWVEYLMSESFQRIQWNPAVINQIVEEKGGKLCYWSDNQMILWDAYGFLAEGPPTDIPEAKPLYELLHPTFWLNKQRQLEAERARLRREEKEKIRTSRKTQIWAAIICLCLLIPFLIFSKITAPSRYLKNYMAQKYPGNLFEITETQELSDGRYAYGLTTQKHPDIRVTARVKKVDSSCELIENYGEQLLEHYGSQYGLGLTCEFRELSYRHSNTEKFRYVIYYPDIENLKEFCRGLLEMLKKEEELAFLDNVSICPKGALYPEAVVEGGSNYPPAEQFYTVAEITDSSLLEQQLMEAYIDYMYNYEAWNLTPQQKAAWNTDYVAKGRLQEAEITIPYELLYLEEDYGLYIPFYEDSTLIVSEYFLEYRSKIVTRTTVGNAYQILEASGAAITVREDRSGFIVYAGDRSFSFGDEKEVSLREILDLREAILDIIEEREEWPLYLESML